MGIHYETAYTSISTSAFLSEICCFLYLCLKKNVFVAIFNLQDRDFVRTKNLAIHTTPSTLCLCKMWQTNCKTIKSLFTCQESALWSSKFTGYICSKSVNIF